MRGAPRLLCSLLLCAASAAQQLSVRGPDPEVVRFGGQSVITLSLDGAREDVELMPLPAVDGVEFQAGPPSRSSFQSIVNGRITAYSSTTWQIAVVPRREGAFEIPPLQVKAGGQILRTRALRVEAVRDVTGEKYAFLEMSVARDRYFVHEPILLKLRFGMDVRFIQGNVLQLFRQQLAMPVQLQARWVTDLPGTVTLEDEPAQGGRSGQRYTFALNDAIAEAVQGQSVERDGRQFAVFEIEKRYLPNRSGELVVPGPLLRFAYATRFTNDVFNGRVPADRHDAFVYGKPLLVQIEPLPEAGRPPGFTGAVGRFAIHAEASPRELKVGESLKLVLRIEGEGNLEFLDPPRLDELKGFHVYGKIEDKQKTRRTVTYDLAPLSEQVTEVPAIPFAFFDTTPPAGYKAARTEPIPLAVRPLPEGARLKPLPGDEARRAVPGENDIFDMRLVAALPRSTAAAAPKGLLAAALLAPWVLALGLILFLRKRERDLLDPKSVRARSAAAAFRGRARQPGAEVAELLAEFLAARLRCPPAAVIAPDLPARLQEAGVPAELARDSAALLEGLVAARYGGAAADARMDEAARLVDALEAAFRAAGEEPVIAWLLALIAAWAPDLGKAEAAYRAGQYQAAAAEFQAALEEAGAAAGPLLYNLGNCSYRLGHHAEAVLYYRRAALRLPRDPELRFNLRLAEQKLGIDAAAQESFGAAVVALVDSFGRGELLALACGLQTAGLLGFVLLRRRRGPRLAMLLLALLGMAAGGRLVRDAWFAPPPAGVVIGAEIAVRSEPRADLPVVLKLKAGELVRVEEQSDRWVRVVHAQGRGWTERAGVGVVE